MPDAIYRFSRSFRFASLGAAAVSLTLAALAVPFDTVQPAFADEPDRGRPAIAASGGLVVYGTRLTLTYDEPLDESSRPAASDFVVTTGPEQRQVNAVAVSRDTVTLTLASTVTVGQTVALDYTPSPSGAIRDLDGNTAAALAGEPVTNETRTNVVLITVDDMNWDSVGAYGSPVPGTTPNIDRLASEGMRFVNAHTTSPVCAPSRRALMTGRYPHVSSGVSFDFLSTEGVPHLPEILRDEGYDVGVLGKVKDTTLYEDFIWDMATRVSKLGYGRNPGAYYRHAKAFAQDAVAESRPFFLVANSNDPHRPFYGNDPDRLFPDWFLPTGDDDPEKVDPSRAFAPEEVVVPGFLPDLPDVRLEISEYYSSVRRADDTVGRLLEALDDAGVSENTLVMFLSDNGMPFPFAKTNVWMNSTRTPWVVRWPGVIAGGNVDAEHLISGIDYLPTVLDALGMDIPAGVNGKSFLPLLQGETQDGRELVFTQFHETFSGNEYPMRSVQDTRFGYIYNAWSHSGGERKFRNESMSGRSWSAMEDAAANDPELAAQVNFFWFREPEEFYDYRNDPDALNNLIDDPEYADEIQRLKDALEEWMEDTNDPLLEKFRRLAADGSTVSDEPQPTACAGPDLTGAPGEEVTLQGRCSTNPYGSWHRMAHAWTQLSGPTVNLSDPSRGDPSFTVPVNAADGTTLEFQLTVTDKEGQTDSDTVVVTVDSNPPPTPPTACAGPDLEAQPGDTVTLQGDCSTNPHGTWWRMAHLWTQPEGQSIVLSGDTIAKPSFTMPSDAAPGAVYTFTLTVTDKDEESDSDNMTVTVPGAAVENRAPAFAEGANATRSLAENSAAGVSVGVAVSATDSDGDALTYSLLDVDATSFGINTETGQLLTIVGVTYDYETKSSYSVTVEAADGNVGTASIAVTINLTNVNEFPAFSEGSSTTRAVAENSPAGTNVGAAITATDPDGDTLIYSLSGTDSNSFSVDADTGQILTIEGVAYDYETQSSYSVTVEATDPDGASAFIDVTVNLGNVNEVPAFTEGGTATREVAENSAAGVNVGAAITTTDPDGDTLTYSLSGTDSASFGIDTETGQLLTIEGVTYDYETLAGYSVTVEAADPDGASASIAVTVNLGNVNEVPAFTEVGTATREVAENSVAGVSVGAPVSATDPDGDALTYSLSGTDAASFAINSETGQLLTIEGATFDYETQASYSVTVTATDPDGASSSIDVTVSLVNVNEVPSFSDGSAATREVAENSEVGVSVGATINATDPDGDTLTYSLSGTDAASFGINTQAGQLLTIEGANYDYETQASYSVTVEAADGNGGTASIAVTVNLGNVNEVPAFTEGGTATREVRENSEVGVSVGAAITATDPDGDTLSYSLSGTDSNSFSIDADTGQLTTVEGVTYDYETQSSYALTVEANDGNGGSASIAVTVTLIDVDETTPVTDCFTDLGAFSAAVQYAGSWDDDECRAHHQDSVARYFQFTLLEETVVTITLTPDSDGALYVSRDTPQNGWGTPPKSTYEDRRRIRRDNGKLVHDGHHTGLNTVTLTLAAGVTYTVEAAGKSDGGTFTITIAPQ